MTKTKVASPAHHRHHVAGKKSTPGGTRICFGNDLKQLALLERAIRRCQQQSFSTLPLFSDRTELLKKPVQDCPMSQRRATNMRSSINPFGASPSISTITKRCRKQPRRNAFVIHGNADVSASLFSVPVTNPCHFPYDDSSVFSEVTSSAYLTDSTEQTSNQSLLADKNNDFVDFVASQLLEESLLILKDGLSELRLGNRSE